MRVLDIDINRDGVAYVRQGDENKMSNDYPNSGEEVG
jgi:hypothetical protein